MVMSSSIRAFLQLLRIPNVFTAIADVCMGYFFVAGLGTGDWPGLFTLCLASSCLYLSGMVFNDVFDLQVDAKERPDRPIPSGRVSKNTAWALAIGLMLTGILLALAGGFYFAAPHVTGTRTGVVAILLATAVLLYDSVMKHSVLLGPVTMGSCRTLNVLLGMSGGSMMIDASILGFNTAQWFVAGGIGTYIAGVTWFARSEATASSRVPLGFGVAVMVLGVSMLALFPRFGVPVRFANQMVWPMLLLLVMFSVVRRCLLAIANPNPVNVQAGVKLCIFSLIVLDAAVTLAVRGPWYGIAVLSLLIPSVVLGRWIYST